MHLSGVSAGHFRWAPPAHCSPATQGSPSLSAASKLLFTSAEPPPFAHLQATEYTVSAWAAGRRGGAPGGFTPNPVALARKGVWQALAEFPYRTPRPVRNTPAKVLPTTTTLGLCQQPLDPGWPATYPSRGVCAPLPPYHGSQAAYATFTCRRHRAQPSRPRWAFVHTQTSVRAARCPRASRHQAPFPLSQDPLPDPWLRLRPNSRSAG